MAVQRFRRLVAQTPELAVEGAVLAIQPLVLADDLRAGVDEHDTGVAVDEQLIAFLDRFAGMLDTDDGRNFERLGQNRGVGGHPATGQHHRFQLLELEQHEVR